MKLDSNVLEETFTLIGLDSILTIQWLAQTMSCRICQCKIIEKSVMGESFVFCLVRLDP